MSSSDLWSLKWISIKLCLWFLRYLFYCQMAVSLLHFCISRCKLSICFRLVCFNYYCQSKIAVLMYLFHQEWFRLFRPLLSPNAIMFLLLITGVIFLDSDFIFLNLSLSLLSLLFLNLSVLCPVSQSKISIFRDYSPLNSYFSNFEK